MANHDISLIPATTLSSLQLSELLNRVYVDYYIPIEINTSQFQQMCYEEDIILSASKLAVVNDIPVGVALLSIRDTCGWISGVGVLPEWRRKGVARTLIQSLKSQAPTLGITMLKLEVLTQNAFGIALYKKLGFVRRRDLLVLSAKGGLWESAPLPAPITYTSPSHLLSAYNDFHDVEVPWQRAASSLLHRDTALKGLGFWEEHQLLGYLLYIPQRHYQTVLDLAVLPGHPQRLEIAKKLLLALHQSRPMVGEYIINVPEEDPLLPVFMTLNYHIQHRQFEMCWSPEALP
ncbi:MAG: GNAT family N-acetyltransferase [Anaerolineae bacterium]|nr:GNAT family N-acetyltransferase [Anaerolineae bacterium]